MKADEYWNKEWTRRRSGVCKPLMNRNKMAKIVYELATRSYLDKLYKLDVGCGTGIHAMLLAGYSMGWRERYTGIDLSEKATEYGREYGFNTICGDFLTYDFGRKFNCFLLLDSLEHFLDHESLAKKIVELAEPSSVVIANVPLFCLSHANEANMERPVAPEDIKNFYKMLNVKDEVYSEVYGSYGYPYMFIEGAMK